MPGVSGEPYDKSLQHWVLSFQEPGDLSLLQLRFGSHLKKMAPLRVDSKAWYPAEVPPLPNSHPPEAPPPKSPGISQPRDDNQPQLPAGEMSFSCNRTDGCPGRILCTFTPQSNGCQHTSAGPASSAVSSWAISIWGSRFGEVCKGWCTRGRQRRSPD